MNQKLIIIGVVAFLILVNVGIYVYNQPEKVYVDPRLENNTAAKEIAELGIKVFIEDLGTDGNGYTVNGQTRIYENGTVAEVVLDDSIYPNGYQAYAILYHELGHVLDPNADEAGADAYAKSRGYNITDAYNGQH